MGQSDIFRPPMQKKNEGRLFMALTINVHEVTVTVKSLGQAYGAYPSRICPNE